MPASCAFFAASYAACCAANGVPLREPRKPRAPADDCAIKFPSRSVIEIIVLLNDAAMCTMPLGTFFFSFLRKTFFFPPALAITFQSNNQNYFLPGAFFLAMVARRGPLRRRRRLARNSFDCLTEKLFLARRLLLGDGGASWSFACARICVRTLATHRQRTTMSQTAIATDVHQTFDVHLNALAQVAFDLSLHFQNVTDAAQLVFKIG